MEGVVKRYNNESEWHRNVCANFRFKIKTEFAIELVLSNAQIWSIWQESRGDTAQEEEHDAIMEMIAVHKDQYEAHRA